MVVEGSIHAGLQAIDPTLVTKVELAIAAERRAFAHSTSTGRAEAAVLDVAGGCAVYTGDHLFSNRAFALGLDVPLDSERLDEIERFYAARGTRTEIELASTAAPELVRLLADRGYRVRRFRHIFARACDEAIPELQSGPTIETVDGSNAHEWSATLIEGFEYADPESIRWVREWNDALLAVPGLTAFIARLDGAAVGSASVLIDGSTAVLGGAATVPRHRRKGVQQALILARLRRAKSAGCDLAVVTADPGSSSGRNTERAGFRLVCTHAVMAERA